MSPPTGRSGAPPQDPAAEPTSRHPRASPSDRTAPGPWGGVTDTARALAALGLWMFRLDHPDLPRCIGRHAPDRPCNGERGKHPVPRSWARESTRDPATLHRMFGRGPRNGGVDCGRSGLAVLDEDAPGELDRLCTDHGQQLPVTFTHAAGQNQDNPPARRAEVIAGGFAAAPAGRRTLHAIIVPCCPHCGFLHQHKSASGQGGRRTGSCGRAYRVVIVGRRKGAA